MRTSEHNRAVARSRWKKVQERERAQINTSPDAQLRKAVILGMLAGDGCLTCRSSPYFSRYAVNCYPDDQEMLDYYVQSIAFIYKKVPRTKCFGKMFEARLSSLTIYQDLTKGAIFGINKWRVPASLVSEEHCCAWLRGFFSAEAYVAPNGIKVQTVNKEGMDDVSRLLTALDIFHSRYTYQSKNPKNSLVHIIWIIRRADKLKYAAKIGFCHTRKTKRLQETLGL